MALAYSPTFFRLRTERVARRTEKEKRLGTSYSRGIDVALADKCLSRKKSPRERYGDRNAPFFSAFSRFLSSLLGTVFVHRVSLHCQDHLPLLDWVTSRISSFSRVSPPLAVILDSRNSRNFRQGNEISLTTVAARPASVRCHNRCRLQRSPACGNEYSCLVRSLLLARLYDALLSSSSFPYSFRCAFGYVYP